MRACKCVCEHVSLYSEPRHHSDNYDQRSIMESHPTLPSTLSSSITGAPPTHHWSCEGEQCRGHSQEQPSSNQWHTSQEEELVLTLLILAKFTWRTALTTHHSHSHLSHSHLSHSHLSHSHLSHSPFTLTSHSHLFTLSHTHHSHLSHSHLSGLSPLRTLTSHTPNNACINQSTVKVKHTHY